MRVLLLSILGALPCCLYAVSIPLLNPGGELNNGVDGTPISNPAVLGWDSNGGQVINERTDYGNGGWRISIEDNNALWQMSGHTISTGESYSLRFDAAIFAGVSTDPDFTPSLTLIEPGLLNGDFNEDTSATDARDFSETPHWFNAGSSDDTGQATRNGPANVLLDGSRNAVLAHAGDRKWGIDTGHTINTGEAFQVVYQWLDASNWNDAADRVSVSLFTTSDDTSGGIKTILQSLQSDLSSANGAYQEQRSTFVTLPASAQGKRLFLYFETIDTNSDGSGFARLDNVVFRQGTSSGETNQRFFRADLYVDDGGSRQVIATRDYDFRSPTPATWHHYHLAVPEGVLDAHAGKTLGVQFRANATVNTNYQSFDNIRLATWPLDAPDGSYTNDWDGTPDQVWLGPGYWANRLHDWEVRSNRVNCILGGRDRRTAHRVGTSIRGNGGDFHFSVKTGLHLGSNNANARTGLLIGAGPGLDWRGALLVHDGLGRDFGLFCGLGGEGQAIIEDLGASPVNTLGSGAVPAGGFPGSARLELNAAYSHATGTYTLTLNVYDAGGVLLSTAQAIVTSDRVLGSLGLLSHKGSSNARFWYDDFSGTGTALQPEPDRHLAILGAMYTLNRGVLKVTAQLSPVHLAGTPPVTFETWTGTNWQVVATNAIDNTDNLSSYTATFRIPNWDDTRDTDFRLGVMVDGAPYTWAGTVRRNPVDKNEIVLALTTCQRIADGNVQGSGFDWSPVRLWQPHTLAFTHMPKHLPDLLIANGDQIYEGQPTPEDSGNAFNRQHDYLYKWYLWVLQAREMTRSMPTIAMPDDHDIYQGNLWGEGGIATGNQNQGGYEEPASWVKLVERTQTSHLPDPDPYNATQPPPPVAQGIGVYFGGMVYGGVGMAIIEDRKFKTGSANPPADLNQQFLIGDRQKDFLRVWNTDWAGQQIKCVVSQSPFGNLHTHANSGYNFGLNDKDAHGWPVHRRNEVWELLRQSRMFQLAGDQHVATVAQHGILGPADAGYSFTAPAIANFFPRSWDPVHNAGGTTPTVSAYTGDFFFDGNGTLPTGQANLNAQDPAHVRMFAVANPEEYYRRTRNISPAALHDRGAGYGIVRIDKTTRRVVFECWPLHADPEYPGTGGQFGDWPITISQTDNDGRVPAGYLPVVDTLWRKNPVVSVYEETTGDLVYSMRVRGTQFRPPVYSTGMTYRVELAYGDDPTSETLAGQAPFSTSTATVHEFSAMQPSIVNGSSATLRWNVENPTTLTIDQGLGDVSIHTVDGIGYLDVSPVIDTEYTLTLNGTFMTGTTVRVFADRNAWNDLHFTPQEQLNPGTFAGDVDADGDGFSNDVEFQFQTDPRASGERPELESAIARDQGSLEVTFTTPWPLQPDVCNLIIESSSNLVHWAELPANSYRETARNHHAQSGTSQITLRLITPELAARPRRYYRSRWEL